MNDAARALLAYATPPHAADTMLFARLIGARMPQRELALLGLHDSALSALIARHFPGATIERPRMPTTLIAHHAFVRDLRALLLWHDRTFASHDDDARALASIIAQASLRPDHLWRDLGLSDRDDVTAMLERHYPALVARNVENLRWKKFFAREVARAHAVAPGCAPGCPGCEDFAFCYPDAAARVPD